MREDRYRVGTWWGLVTGEVVAMLPTDVPEEAVVELYEELARDGNFSPILTRLAASVGGNLLNLPPFAVHVREGDRARVLVRGAVVARLGNEVLDGGGTMTWQERVVPPGAGVVFTTGEHQAGAALPIGAGVVRCSELTIGAGARLAVVARHAAPPIAFSTAPIAHVANTTNTPDTLDVAAVAAAPAPDRPIDLPPVSQPTIVGVEEEFEAAPAPASAPVPLVTRAPLVEHVPGTDGGSSYDSLLFGATVSRNVQDAAVWSLEDSEPDEPDSDHDNHTLSIAESRKLAAAISGLIPVIDARASAVGRLRVSTGQECAIDRPVLIGRRPQAARVRADEVPHLLTVPSPNQDISRSHVEIRPEGSHVTAADLGTTNGTILRRPGRQAVRMVASERQVLLDGDVLDLGDGITVTYSEGDR